MNAPDIPNLTYVRYLASGGCATVYLYRDRKHAGRVDREVAVKVLNDAANEQFEVEAKAMLRLGNHLHIVQVFDVDTTADGRAYLVMQYYPNRSLGQQVDDGTVFSVQDTLRIGIKIASAVETAHRAEILHRDIKPANILTDEYGEPALADFGIAGLVHGPDDEDILLSLPWSPPEVVNPASGRTSSAASDVYSLGASLWHLLAGHYPFWEPGSTSRRELTDRIERAPRTPTGRPDVPRSLEQLLIRALDRNPDLRPRSALEFATELQRVERECGHPVTPTVLPSQASGIANTVRRDPAQHDPARREPPAVERTSLRQPVHTAPRQPVEAPQPRQPAPLDRTALRLPPVENTRLRERPPEPEPEAEPKRGKTSLVLAGLGATAAVGLGIVLLSPTDQPSADTKSTNTRPANTVADVPPGRPTVAAARASPTTLRFTWTYSAQFATDTFQWRTKDNTKSGVAEKPTLDLDATGELCVQVKVVRADGSHAATEWSAAGCGR